MGTFNKYIATETYEKIFFQDFTKNELEDFNKTKI